MPDPRHERFAQVLVDYSTSVGEGDLVLIGPRPSPGRWCPRSTAASSGPAGIPRRGWRSTGGARAARGGHGRAARLDQPRAPRRQRDRRTSGSPSRRTGTRRRWGIEPARQASRRGRASSCAKRYVERAAAGDLRGCSPPSRRRPPRRTPRCRSPITRTSSTAPASSTRRIRSRPGSCWGGGSRASESGSPTLEAAHRRRGHGPHPRRRGPHLDPCAGQGELSRRRGLHRPRGRAWRDVQLHVPGRHAGPRGRARSRLRFEGGEVVEAPRARARTSSGRCSPWTTAHGGSASSRSG